MAVRKDEATDLKPRPNYNIYIKVLRRMTAEQHLLKAFELSALKVYEVQYPQLNMEYLNDWVRQLHLTAPFNKLIGEAKIIL
ncbi:MAG: hypothetical protein MUP71_09115 [Candidatus Aminicenantes bacterium]|nr:hypothetical protein [Candidatus Aminicenantes bacterium]